MRRIKDLVTVEKEALELATALGNPDLLFDARALEIRALHLQGKTREGLLQLDYLQREPLHAEQQAEANYLRYRMMPEDENARQTAVALFQALYTEKPQYLFKLRLEKLGKGGGM
ncbi:MAG: hypothetical protein R2795_04355 [Saprospiraceae bacterium]